MHRFAIAALLALGLASAAFAADPVGPFKLDAAGKCHAANGQFAKAGFCKPKPQCVKGKLCGNSCIKATDVCHVP